MKKWFIILLFIIMGGVMAFAYWLEPKINMESEEMERERTEFISPAKEGGTDEFTPTTDTVCNDGTCTVSLYSGIRNAFEDGEWKRVENARSLKGKGYNIVYLEDDDTHKIDVVDFNLSFIQLGFSYDEENIGEYEYELEDGKMKTKFKILEYNETGDEVEREIEIEIEEEENYEYVLYENPLGKRFQLGDGSTTIQLQENDTENLGDGHVIESIPDSNYGASSDIYAGESDADTAYASYFKFDISQVPADKLINNAEFNWFIDSNGYEAGEDITVWIWEVSNVSWDEGNSTGTDCSQPLDCEYGNTWNRKPTVGGLIDTNTDYDGNDDDFWLDFDVTPWVSSVYTGGGVNTSFMVNATMDYGAFDRITGTSKEHQIPSQLPYLNITYSITLIAHNLSINFTSPTPNDGSTQGDTDIYVSVNASDTISNVSTFIDFDSSLVGWWMMDYINASGDVTDYTDNNNDGTAFADAVQIDAGKLGKAFEFDGVGDYILVENDSSLDFPNNWSISVWVKITNNNGALYQYFISSGGYQANPSINWFFTETGDADPNKLRIAVGDDDSTDREITSTGSYGTSTDWQHLVLVRAGAKVTQYINTVADGTATESLLGTFTLGDWYFGGRSDKDSDRFFNGTIDDILIFNRALSTEEIIGLYANQTTKYLNNNFTELEDGNYTFIAYAQNLAGHINSTEERKVTVEEEFIYSLDILEPTTSTPLTVTYPQNITINFTLTENKINITSGLTINNITIGGNESPVVSYGTPLVPTTIDFETFGTNLGDWTTSYGVDSGCVWQQDTDGTPSLNTGPCEGNSNCLTNDAGADDNSYAYVETSSGDCNTGNAHAYLNYSDVDMDANPNIVFKFAYDMFGLQIGNLSFQIDGVAIWSITGDQGQTTGWQNVTLDLSGYSGTRDLIFDYYRNGETDFRGDAAIDILNITSSSGGIVEEFGHVEGTGWVANVTIAGFADGLKDLFLNISYNEVDYNTTQINAINYGGVGDCLPTLDEDWVITDEQVCDGVEKTTGTGSVNISTSGTLHLINGANLTIDKLYLQTTGDQVFVGSGSELRVG